jgi:hypothetical protein
MEVKNVDRPMDNASHRTNKYPIPSDYVPRTFVVRPNRHLPRRRQENTNLRINELLQRNLRLRRNRHNPTGNHNSQFKESTQPPLLTKRRVRQHNHPPPSGNFTKYGDVTPLLLEADDMYVIGLQGDRVTLKVPNLQTSCTS